MYCMSEWANEIKGLAWTLAGTGLVLITLTGSTRRLGLIISAAGLAINLIAFAFTNKENK